MKKQLVLVLFLFLVPVINASSFSNSSRVLYYNFDEGTGIYANDSNGKNNALITGAGWTEGRQGYGLIFDGRNDYVYAGDFYGFETKDSFINTGLVYDTLEDVFWVGRFSTVANNSIVKMSRTGECLGEIQLNCTCIQGIAYDSSDDTLWFGDCSAEKKGIRHVTKNGTELEDRIETGKLVYGIGYEPDKDSIWAVLKYLRVGTGGAVFRYSAADGMLAEKLSVIKNGIIYLDGIYYDTSDNTLWITQDPNTILHVDPENGNILDKFNSQVNVESITVDPTDNTLWYGADAQYHRNFTGGNRIYHIDKNGRILDLINGFTISAWIKPAGIGVRNQIVIEKYNGTIPVEFNLFIDSNGKLSSFMTRRCQSQTKLENNKWQHVAMAYNTTHIMLYYNGEMVGACKDTYYPNYGKLIIGIRPAGLFFPFKGTMDEVGIYNRVLSQEEIRELTA